jgi:hypothetical protein
MWAEVMRMLDEMQRDWPTHRSRRIVIVLLWVPSNVVERALRIVANLSQQVFRELQGVSHPQQEWDDL